jgi:hypothetical protein
MATDSSAFSPSNRARECMERARGFLVESNDMAQVEVLKEVISLAREALTLSSSVGRDDDIIYECSMLAHALQQTYEFDNDLNILVEATYFARKALSIATEGHPARADCCGILANSLKRQYDAFGDDRLFDEAIYLERQALVLRSEDDPHRASAYGNMASSLRTRYQSTGDDELLKEATYLERKALDLRHEGDPDRAASCVNLATSLMDRYRVTNEDRLLVEAISLQREALNLWPEEHPRHPVLCANLAISMGMRYNHIDDEDLIMNAINLEREVLSHRPVGSPHRAASCARLAVSLTKRFERHKEDQLLVEAIELEREAISLCHEGDHYRLVYSGNLASSLHKLYHATGDIALLMEGIDLRRKMLAICPDHHPHYIEFCGNLAMTLQTLYESNGDESLLDEILIYGQVAAAHVSPHVVWRLLCSLAWVHLQIITPFYDVSQAISYLSRCLEHEPDDIRQVAYAILFLLNGVWRSQTEKQHLELMIVYRRLVNFLPLLAHPALKPKQQLRALSVCSQVGFDAFVNAALAGRWTSAFDLLELAQGVIWSQGLHIRDPQLQAVPEPMRQNLESLLFAIAGQATDDKFYDGQPTNLTSQDVLHDRSSQSLVLIRRIRELPGLEHFMLGETFEALCTAATTHPVVVLVGARNYFYAIIIGSSQAKDHALLSLDLTERDIEGLSSTYIFTTSQRRGAMPDNLEVDLARLQLGKSAPLRFGPWYQQMNVLWVKIVKPVLEHLELKVSILEERK